MFKADPLSPLRAYFNTYCVTGLGLFVEGYTLFSVGNLGSIFKSVWPACFKTYAVCDKNWVHACDYLQVVGIIVGQIGVGVESDWIGRRVSLTDRPTD